MKRKKLTQAAVFFCLMICLFYSTFQPGISYAEETGSLPVNAIKIPVVKDPDLVIRVIQDKKVLLEKKVYIDDFKENQLTRQIYTSIDGDDSPELILAEGIPLTEMLKMLNVNLDDVQSFNIFSSEGWERGFTKKFLFDVQRCAYPEIFPDLEPGQENVSINAFNNEAKLKDDASLNEADSNSETAVSEKDAEYAFTSKQPVLVKPMLTFRSYEKVMGVTADWKKLSNKMGIRICYGQMNFNDVCSPLYGTHINQLEINLKTSEKDEDENGYIATITGGSDDGAGDKVAETATDPVTGKQINNVPLTLTIKAGYFGTEYTELKTFTLAELKSLPKIKQAYTLIDDKKSVIVDTAVGVRLVDLLAAAGIDPNAVQALHFYSYGTEEGTAVSYTRSYLLGTPRYFYPRLSSCWNGGPTAGAARGAVRVDTIIALKDFWKKSTTAPDFYSVNGNSRFRLLFGQTNTTAETASHSLPWIHTIEVQMSGMPTEGNGKFISSGQSGEGSSEQQNGSQGQTEKFTAGKTMQKIETSASVANGSGNGGSKKSVYALSAAKEVPAPEPVHHFGLIGIGSLCILLLGAMNRYWGYHREFRFLKWNVE